MNSLGLYLKIYFLFVFVVEGSFAEYRILSWQVFDGFFPFSILKMLLDGSLAIILYEKLAILCHCSFLDSFGTFSLPLILPV